MIYILDTNILDAFFDGDTTAVQNILQTDFSEMFITPVNVQEFLAGPINGLNSLKNCTDHRIFAAFDRLSRYIKAIDAYQLLPYTEEANSFFKELTTRASSVSTNDRRIAAIALAYRAVVVTRNRKDFTKLLPDVLLQDWNRSDKGIGD